MVDITHAIEEFKNGDLPQIRDRWNTKFMIQYSSLYRKAYKKFDETLERQITVDRLKTELALTALSFCSGSLLTVAFSSVAIKSMVANGFLNFICRYNMNRTFNLAYFLSNNITASFLLGKFWESGKSLFSSRIKKQFVETVDNYEKMREFCLDPADVRDSLEYFIGASKIKIYNVCEELLSSELSSSEKEVALSMIVNSPYSKLSERISVPDDYALKIELSFYLNMIMNSDSLVEGVLMKTDPAGGNKYVHCASSTLSLSPEDPSYRVHYRSGPNHEFKYDVVYDHIGQAFIDRMNYLYNEIFKLKGTGKIMQSSILGARTSKDILLKASKALKQLSLLDQQMTMQ